MPAPFSAIFTVRDLPQWSGGIQAT